MTQISKRSWSFRLMKLFYGGSHKVQRYRAADGTLTRTPRHTNYWGYATERGEDVDTQLNGWIQFELTNYGYWVRVVGCLIFFPIYCIGWFFWNLAVLLCIGLYETVGKFSVWVYNKIKNGRKYVEFVD